MIAHGTSDVHGAWCIVRGASDSVSRYTLRLTCISAGLAVSATEIGSLALAGTLRLVFTTLASRCQSSSGSRMKTPMMPCMSGAHAAPCMTQAAGFCIRYLSPFNPETSVLIQARHLYIESLNGETWDSKCVFTLWRTLWSKEAVHQRQPPQLTDQLQEH